jgi:hypothetical protein
MSEVPARAAGFGGFAAFRRGCATLLPMAGSGRHGNIRRSYDAVAEKYADGFRDELAYKPLDRALLTCLIEQTGQGAPIADLGCGPGHVSGWLASHGATAVGIDLSADMIAVPAGTVPAPSSARGTSWSCPRATASSGRPSRSTRSSTLSPASCTVPSRRSIACCGRPG